MRSVAAAILAAWAIAMSARGAPPGPATTREGGAAEPVAGRSPDLSKPRGSVMTGTVAERKTAIEKALADNGGKVAQMSFNDMDMGQALRFFANQRRIDIALSEDALAKAGIEPGMKVTLDLHHAGLRLILEAIRWPMRPTEGAVEWRVEEGVLTLEPVAQVERAVETPAEKAEDAAQRALLKKPMPMDAISGKDMPVSALMKLMVTQLKVNMVVDWKELEKAGVDKEVKMAGELKSPTGEDVLNAALGAMKAKEAVGYEVWGGLVRVSTRGRLDKEKPVAGEAGGEMP